MGKIWLFDPVVKRFIREGDLVSLFFKETFHFLRQQLQNWKSWLWLSAVSFLIFFCVGALVGISCLAYGLIFMTFVRLAGWVKLLLFAVLVGIIVGILREGCGYLNLVAANALDAAHGRPLRMMENRIDRLATLFIYFVYVLSILLASCFLLVPGVMVWVYCSLAYWVMLEENLSMLDSMVRSYQLIKGHFWAMLLMLLILAVLRFIPLFWLVSMCFPVVSLSMASVYVKLKNRHTIA